MNSISYPLLSGGMTGIISIILCLTIHPFEIRDPDLLSGKEFIHLVRSNGVSIARDEESLSKLKRNINEGFMLPSETAELRRRYQRLPLKNNPKQRERRPWEV